LFLVNVTGTPLCHSLYLASHFITGYMVGSKAEKGGIAKDG
jgi:hypothetical protein